jgi:hypothetical protein
MKMVKIMFCMMSVVFIGMSSNAQANTLNVGVELSGITYKEPHMQQKGSMVGLTASYAHCYDNNAMVQVQGIFKYGQVNYAGRLESGIPISISNIDNYIAEARVLGGYKIRLNTLIIVTPYTGIGYRYLADDMGNASIYGYDRESNYFYSPVGLEILTPLQNGWSVKVILEYDIFWKGLQKSHLSDIRPEYNTLKKDQNNGYGLKGSVKFQKGNFSVEPFVRYWSIADSEKSLLTFQGQSTHRWYFEPRNSSTEIGLKIAWKF